MDWTQRRLCLLFTPELCRGEPWTTLGAALDAGVGLVQWRAEVPDRDGLARCMAACDSRGVPVIVNDHVQLAVEAKAAGVHVGQDDIDARTARARLGSGQVLGVSTHDADQARDAQAAGADYVGVGPCFPTATKGYSSGLGPEVLAAMLSALAVPAFAIGGLTPDNIGELLDLGLRHFAISGAILGAEDPAAAVERFRRAIGG